MMTAISCGAGAFACHFFLRYSHQNHTCMSEPPAYAGIPQKTASYPHRQRSSVHHLAFMGITTSQTRSDHICHSRPSVRGAGPHSRSTAFGSALAQGPSYYRTGIECHSARRLQPRFLSSGSLGRDAEPRAFADYAPGAHPCNDAMAKGINGPKRQSNIRPDWAAVLAGRILGPLPAHAPANRPDRGLHREEPGFGRAGVFPRAVAVVQRRMAGENACPTKHTRGLGLIRCAR
jgi:hypothetical protein